MSTSTLTAAATTWAIDAAHSEIQFKVKHLVITTVTGSFTEFKGSVTTGDKFPTLSFNSTRFKRVDDEEYALEGDLTIKGVTKPVKFHVEYAGSAKDPWGHVKAGFELKGTINRKEFGLTWNALTEAGGALVSEEVKLIANLQLVKQ